MQAATNLRRLCWVCGVHPALAASPEGCCDPDQHRLSLAVTRSSTIQQHLISTKMLVSLLVRHLMSTGLQFIAVVTQQMHLQLQQQEAGWQSFVGFRSWNPPSKEEDWKLVSSRHSACFYIQPSYKPVLSRGGCLRLPPQKGVCHSLCCDRQKIH